MCVVTAGVYKGCEVDDIRAKFNIEKKVRRQACEDIQQAMKRVIEDGLYHELLETSNLKRFHSDVMKTSIEVDCQGDLELNSKENDFKLQSKDEHKNVLCFVVTEKSVHVVYNGAFIGNEIAHGHFVGPMTMKTLSEILPHVSVDQIKVCRAHHNDLARNLKVLGNVVTAYEPSSEEKYARWLDSAVK